MFGRMVQRGHIYRGKKPVHWSPSSQTALAEAVRPPPLQCSVQGLFGRWPALHLQASYWVFCLSTRAYRLHLRRTKRFCRILTLCGMWPGTWLQHQSAQTSSCVSQHRGPEAPEGLPCFVPLHGQCRSDGTS